MKEELIEFVRTSLPELKINGAEVNTEGWDNDILIVNQQLVFRFPKTRAIADKIHVETSLLDLLRKQKPLVKVPEYYKLTDENGDLRCVYYDYMDGAPLKGCPPDEKSARLLGDFLTKLHSIEPAETDLKIEKTYTFWQNLFKSVQKEIYPRLNAYQRDKIHTVFVGFLNAYDSNQKSDTIVHGDLTASNIICKNERVTGVIDFTDAQLGDPAMDFAGFYWSWGPEFTKEVLSRYKGTEPAESILERVESFYGLQPAFHELLHAVRNDKAAEWNQALARFSALAR